jgi:hypothetical protein
MMQPLYYLAGPMRGYEQFNFPAFAAATADLRARGVRVISPAEMALAEGFNPQRDTPDRAFIQAACERDVTAVLKADAVVLLPGWEASVGATAEAWLATWRGIPVLEYPDLNPVEIAPETEYPNFRPPPAREQPIIGLVGAKGCGKDTLFAAMRHYQPDLMRLAFADALKAEVAQAFGVSTAYIDQHKAHFRTLLQTWGTEVRRSLWGENYWLGKMAVQLSGLAKGRRVVITDVRFPNEVEFVRSRGGKIILVQRSTGSSTDTHASEQLAVDPRLKPDAVVFNDGSLSDLGQEARLLAQPNHPIWQ